MNLYAKQERLVRLLILFLALAGTLHAQTVLEGEERLAKDRPEFWAMKLVGSELLLTTMGLPQSEVPWSVDLGLETGWIPALSEDQQLIGFTGTKRENVNRTSLFARPRIQIGLPHQFGFTAGYVPPVRIGGIRPNVLSLSVGRPVFSTSRWRTALRLYGGFGNLKGDITCDRETVAFGNDEVRNPYLCEAVSRDTMTIRSIGLELGNGFPLSPTLEPYVAVAWNYFDTRFDADARYSGLIDRSSLTGAGPTFSLTSGLMYRVAERFRLSGEVFYTPLDIKRLRQPRITDSLVNVRAAVFYEFR